jgi:aminopeptidase N
MLVWYLLSANTTFAYSHRDSLRGANGPGRNWWDVQHYNLSVQFDSTAKKIYGRNIITLKKTAKGMDSLQIDLQEPMVLEKVTMQDYPLQFSKDGDAYWVKGNFADWPMDKEIVLVVDYYGKPRQAKLPPWEGGFIWVKDSSGKPWISVACQGLGASAWWPCKDYQGDEPDKGMNIKFRQPYKLTTVSNGRKVFSETDCDGFEVTSWELKNPINSYNVAFYIGDYVSWQDTMRGEKGVLDLSFYALRYNEEKARKQFAVAKQMLHCFEHWMGPYPFYEDGYKLVEAPFLGMEHQSAVAYGNGYKMGYKGTDRSGTGVGDNFDFIIIHESGHEWYGNNITAADVADNWIHEGFTTYTEALFAECLLGKDKAFEYTRGEWQNIRNDKPVIGDYGVKNDGSSDKYDKGSAVVHMVRMMMANDEKFRQMLRDMNSKYYHKMVTSSEIENYIQTYSGLELTAFFNQYLRTRDIPQIEWSIKNKKLNYRFTNVVAGFTIPLEVSDGDKKASIKPTTEWQSADWKGGYDISFSKDFLIKPKP